MFSNLIESGSHAAHLKRKGRFFLATTAFYGLLLAVTGVGSIYAYNVRLDHEPEYEIVALMRFPPAAARDEGARREEPRAASAARSTQVVTRTEISTQTPYRERVASARTPEVRPNQAVVLGDFNSPPEVSGGTVGVPSHGSRHGSGNDAGPAVPVDVEQPPPALPTPTPKHAPTPRADTGPVRLTSSVISGKTIEKPAPPYPAIAKAANIQGAVAVQIVIDEEGRVIAAKATSGPPLLMNAAVQAAYRARFTPTVLTGKHVKVTGSITYNFVLR
ncbi:MAG TPA: energy transducer TonB [Pyrinomonadaceae bacterium]